MQKLNKKEFTQFIVDQLLERVTDIKIKEVKELSISFAYQNEEESIFNLDNAFREYQMDIDELTEITDRYLSSMLLALFPKELIDVSNCLPVIRRYDFLENMEGSHFSENLVYEKYNSELYVFYVHETEFSLSFVTQEDISRIDINVIELKENALSNLRKLAIERHSLGESGACMITCGGNFESSLILYKEIWIEENFPVDGEIVISIPSRDIVLIGDSSSQSQIRFLLIQDIHINFVGS